MKPNGSPLSEAERVQITAFMNKRLRTNGLAPKEIMLKRRLKDHAALEIDDMSEGQAQFDRREKANAQQKVKDSLISIYPENPKLSVADLVYIKSDLSKSRARERYIVTKVFQKDNHQWILARKFNKGLRNKEYLLKASEVVQAPSQAISECDKDEDSVMEENFQGFSENIFLDKRERLKALIEQLQSETETKNKRGRPKKLSYPDYLRKLPTDVEATEEDEVLYGYDTYDVTQAQHNHQQLQQVIDNLEQQEEEDFHGFSDFEIQLAMDNKEKNMKRVNDIDRLLVKLRSLKRKRHDNVNKRAHPWVHQE